LRRRWKRPKRLLKEKKKKKLLQGAGEDRERIREGLCSKGEKKSFRREKRFLAATLTHNQGEKRTLI